MATIVNIKRVFRVFAAHGYGQVITLASIFSLPYFLIKEWGAVGLGYWITLSALSQVCLMADLGLSLSVPNELCIDGRDERYKAFFLRAVFFKLLRNVFFVWLLVSFLAISYFFLGIDWRDRVEDLLLAFLLMAFNCCMQPIVVFYSGYLRIGGDPEKGVLFANHSRFMEVVVVLLFVHAGFGLAGVAFWQLSVRLMFSIWVVLKLKDVLKQGRLVDGIGGLDRLESVGKSGYGFSIIKTIQHVSIQAPVLVLSYFVGPVSAAAYSLARTLSRTALQPINIIFASISHELTEYVSNNNIFGYKGVVKKLMLTSILFVGLVCLCVCVFLREIEVYWLSGKVGVSYQLLIPLCFSAMAGSVSLVLSQSLAAINKTQMQARVYLMVGVFVVLASVVSCVFFKFDYIVAWVVFFSEVAMIPILVAEFRRVK